MDTPEIRALKEAHSAACDDYHNKLVARDEEIQALKTKEKTQQDRIKGAEKTISTQKETIQMKDNLTRKKGEEMEKMAKELETFKKYVWATKQENEKLSKACQESTERYGRQNEQLLQMDAGMQDARAAIAAAHHS